jgi:cell division protein FtsW
MRLAVTTLIVCVAGLLALGIVMLYSSSMADTGRNLLVMQLVWCAIGFGLCLTAAVVDYRRLKPLAWPLFGLAVVLLTLVWAPKIGIRIHGSNRWVGIKGTPISLQPSELAKLALVMVLAWYGERYLRQMSDWKRGILIPAAFIGIVLALIFREPDRGATMLLAAVSGAMLLIAGVRWRYILPPLVLGATALVFSLLHDPNRSKRIFAWLNPEETKGGVGYQAYNSMLALGTGGWTGTGLGNGMQKLGFLPMHTTDFIFSSIGEELGLVASLLVIIGFVAIVVSGLFIAGRAPDPFGLLLGSGVTFLIGLQAAINIGVVTNTLPNKGMSLPFISYGGSNLLMALSWIGLLLSIARHARAPDSLRERSADPDLADPDAAEMPPAPSRPQPAMARRATSGRATDRPGKRTAARRQARLGTRHAAA